MGRGYCVLFVSTFAGMFPVHSDGTAALGWFGVGTNKKPGAARIEQHPALVVPFAGRDYFSVDSIVRLNHRENPGVTFISSASLA